MSSVTQHSDPRAQKSLRHSLRDAGAYATMFGAGESYLSAFAIFLKATTPQIGMLAAMPGLLASFVQLFSAWMGKRLGRRRVIILAGASLQALMWIPVAVLPLAFPGAAVPLLIVAVVIYQCGAHLAAPQWGSLMGDIVPERRRGRFFALRTRVVSFVTFVSLVGGGIVLHHFDTSGATLTGFLVVFAIAMTARWISVYHLAKMHDPPGRTAPEEATIGRDWLCRVYRSNFVRFSLFFALMQFSVAIASPYFSLLMLRDLDYSYGQFMANSGASVLAQFLTLNQWGRISDVFGNRRVLATTGILLPLMPLLWILSQEFWYLLGVQALSGLAWAGFTLASGNFLYDLTVPERRTTYLATHNILAAVGVFCGAACGGYLALVLPRQFEFNGVALTLISPLLFVFAVSAVARAAVLAVLLPRIREARRVRPTTFSNVIFRVTRVNALAGLVFDIIGARPRTPRD